MFRNEINWDKELIEAQKRIKTKRINQLDSVLQKYKTTKWFCLLMTIFLSSVELPVIVFKNPDQVTNIVMGGLIAVGLLGSGVGLAGEKITEKHIRATKDE
jgi:hypothetical protein